MWLSSGKWIWVTLSSISQIWRPSRQSWCSSSKQGIQGRSYRWWTACDLQAVSTDSSKCWSRSTTPFRTRLSCSGRKPLAETTGFWCLPDLEARYWPWIDWLVIWNCYSYHYPGSYCSSMNCISISLGLPIWVVRLRLWNFKIQHIPLELIDKHEEFHDALQAFDLQWLQHAQVTLHNLLPE